MGLRHPLLYIGTLALVSCSLTTDLPGPGKGEEPPPNCDLPSALCGGECVDVLSSLAHCGSCGSACSHDGAQSACVGGVCELDACDAGRLDCDGDPANGCEIDASDPENCGACGVVCDVAPPNGTAACTAGSCTAVTCNSGYADCDGMAANGCEVLLASDGQHCASCGHSCLQGDCLDGACQPLTIATAQSNVRSLVANDTHVYWTAYRDPDPQGPQGGVQRADATTLETVAIIQQLCEPTSIAIDQTNLYVGDLCTFINQDAEEVYKANLDGSLLIPLSDGNGCKGPIALADGKLYFWGLDNLSTAMYSIDTTGGGPTVLFTDSTLVSFNATVSDGNALYWTTNGLSIQRIKMWDLTSATPSISHIWSDGLAVGLDLAIGGDQLYALVNSSQGVISIDPGVGIQTVDAAGIGAVATDDTHVYYGAADELRRKPLAGGGSEMIATGLTRTPRTIAVTDTAIYWETDGAIMRLAK